VNFFLVNDRFVLVDLPGYGYARLSRERKGEWRSLIDEYLRRTKQLRGIVLLLDIRREPTDDDRMMLDLLAELEIPTLVAITKSDKYGPVAGSERVESILKALDLDPEQIIVASSRTGAGRSELAEAILELVEQPAWRAR
jgi:GTP-binding protein